jgi:hypothetical protein
MKGKALRRVLRTTQVERLSGVPSITDVTELITPEVAYEMLLKNKNNRPVNWRTVEEYAKTMKAGGWKLTPQGIVLDADGYVLTGQQRLWAVIYSNASVHIRISRGNQKEIASLLDRQRPQSSRDLATRKTGRKHSPIESSIARAVLVIDGELRPSVDALAKAIEGRSDIVASVLKATEGTKKSRAVLMILAAICWKTSDSYLASLNAGYTEKLCGVLESELNPESASTLWGRGAAFRLAMDRARIIVERSWKA